MENKTLFFKLIYPDGRVDVVAARSDLDVIKTHDLWKRENAGIRVFQISGEQEAIARADYNESEV